MAGLPEVGAGHPPGLHFVLVRQRLLLMQRGAAQRHDLEGLMMEKICDLALDIPSISPEEPPSSTALVWAAALVLLAIVLTVVLIRRDGRKPREPSAARSKQGMMPCSCQYPLRVVRLVWDR